MKSYVIVDKNGVGTHIGASEIALSAIPLKFKTGKVFLVRWLEGPHGIGWIEHGRALIGTLPHEITRAAYYAAYDKLF